MPRTIVDLKELREFAKRGSLRVLTMSGNFDIIPGRMLGYYMKTSYVLSVMV